MTLKVRTVLAWPLCAASLFFCGAAANAASYNAVSDFSLNSNPNGVWSYIDANSLLVTTGSGLGLSGWLTPVLGFGNEGVFQNTTGATLTWPPNTLPGLPVAIVPTNHLYLSTSINNTVLRFTAPAGGTYTIAGDFLGIASVPVAHNVAVLVNGNSIFSGTIATYQQSAPFNFAKALNAGDTVDFVNYGLPNISLAYGLPTGLAVNISVASPAPAPTITTGGIVPVYSNVSTIQAGEWISIYGTNLASTTAVWNGDFPLLLANTTVTINGKSGYLWYVSPTQINLQVPQDTATGPVPVVVTTPGGSVVSTVMLAQFAPSFSLLDSKHVAGIILRSEKSGAFGGGTYDIIGPTGTSLGYKTVAAKAGDSVALYAVGLGATDPAVPAGAPYSGAAATKNPVTILINNMNVTPTFSGETSAGLYQLNLQIPSGLGVGDMPLQVIVGGLQTPAGAVISLQ